MVEMNESRLTSIEQLRVSAASVVACGREQDHSASAQGGPSGCGGETLRRRLDLRGGCARGIRAPRYGRLDVLVNNAGVMEQVNMLAGDVDGAAITLEIAINLTAPILLVRRCLPLLQHGRRPLIVMVTSGYALLPARRAPTTRRPRPDCVPLTQALRYQLQDSGIRGI